MRLQVSKVEYVAIDESKKDQHTGQPDRRTGSLVVAGVGHEGIMASLMEHLQPLKEGERIEVTRVDHIRDGVVFYPQDLMVPAKELRAAMEAVTPTVGPKSKKERRCVSAEAGIVCGEPESAHTKEAARMDVGMDHKFEPGPEEK